jgi:hypothetical protein
MGPTIFVPRKTPISSDSPIHLPQKISPVGASILVLLNPTVVLLNTIHEMEVVRRGEERRGSARSHPHPSHGPRQHGLAGVGLDMLEFMGLDGAGADDREGPHIGQGHVPEAHGPRRPTRVCCRARGLSCHVPDEAPRQRSGVWPRRAPSPPASPRVAWICAIVRSGEEREYGRKHAMTPSYFSCIDVGAAGGYTVQLQLFPVTGRFG